MAVHPQCTYVKKKTIYNCEHVVPRRRRGMHICNQYEYNFRLITAQLCCAFVLIE